MKKILLIILVCFVSGCAQTKNNSFDIVKEDVEAFDETPIAYLDLGYIVRVDGQYGFMDENGTYIFEPCYSSILISEQDVLLQDPLHAVTISIKEQKPISFGGLGGMITSSYVYDQTNEEYGKVFQDKSYVKENVDRSRIVYRKEEATEKGIAALQDADYYIYIKNENRCYGPYTYDEYATYSYHQKDSQALYFDVGPDYTVSGLFYEKVNNQYRIHTATDTKQTKELFDEVVFLSPQCAQVKQKDRIGIVDQEANVYMFDQVQDVSDEIHGKTWIKQDGHWHLVKLK